MLAPPLYFAFRRGREIHGPAIFPAGHAFLRSRAAFRSHPRSPDATFPELSKAAAPALLRPQSVQSFDGVARFECCLHCLISTFGRLGNHIFDRVGLSRRPAKRIRSMILRRAIIATNVVSDDCSGSNRPAFFQMSTNTSCTASSASSALRSIRRASDHTRPP